MTVDGSISLDSYAGSRAASERQYGEARKYLSGGVNHNVRYAEPFPLYFGRASGSRKWDIDGNEYLDHAMGAGSQLLGHWPESVREAITGALEEQMLLANCTALETEWARIALELLPSAERARFVASGAEATLLAIRLARAHTGRPTLLRFEGHWHGWHDYGMIGFRPPFGLPSSAGVPEPVLGTVETASPKLAALDAIESRLAREDVAAAIVEPSGASWGSVPPDDGFNRKLRELTEKYGTLLVFDEMITGFRWSPGGVQARDGISPDLTTLGKILTGGMHGGAVVGKAAVLDALIPTAGPEDGYVLSFGTFNGHPLSAAAGIATLEQVRDGSACRTAAEYGERMRAGLQEIVEDEGVAGFSYGEESAFHVYLVERGSPLADRWSDPRAMTTEEYLGMPRSILGAMQRGLRSRGVDFWTYNGGIGSAAHTEADLGSALDAFASALAEMKEQGLVASR